MADEYSPIQPYNPNQAGGAPTGGSTNPNIGGMIQNSNNNAQNFNVPPQNQPMEGNYQNTQSNTGQNQPTPNLGAQIPDQTGDEYYQEPKSNVFTVVIERVRENPLLAGIIGVVFLGLIIFGFLIFSLGGETTPTDQGNNQNVDPGTGTGSAVFLQMWGMFLDDEVMQPLIDQYQAQNPGVTIDYANKQSIGARANSLQSYQDELGRVFTNNDPAQQPDIFMVGNTWGGDFEPFAAANPLYTEETYAQVYYPAALTDHVFAGSVYAIPAWMDTYAIIYNRDILESNAFTEPPTTWPEFKNLAKAISSSEVGGFGAGYSVNTDFSSDLLLLLMIQNGVNITNSEGFVNFAASPEAISALDFLQSFRREGIWSTDFDNASAEFLRGNTAMIAVPSWRLRDILSFNDSQNLGIDIGISAMPQIPGQDQQLYNWATYWSYMVNGSRPNSAAAWQFLTWLNEPEQQRQLSQNIENQQGYFGLLYARKDMSGELSDNQYLSTYANSLSFAESFYQVKGTKLEEELEALVDGSSASSNALNSVQSRIRELIANKGILTAQ